MEKGLLVTRHGCSSPRITAIKVQSVPEAAYALEKARRQGEVLGVYLPHLNLTITPCSCERGCAVCQGSLVRTWSGFGPLAPYLAPTQQNEASQ